MFKVKRHIHESFEFFEADEGDNMMQTSEVYDYLKEHADQITEEWLSTRVDQPGSFYSKSAPADVERILRKQHQQTVQLLISSLKPGEDDFEKLLVNWAQTVAKSRVENRIPIYEVLKFLRKTRRLFWRYVEQFINQSDESICKEAEREWSEIIHSTYDEMVIMFAEYYHEFNERRLSEHQALIKLLEIPLIKICDKVSVLPVIGVINSDRGLSLLNEIPLKCSEANVESLIMDLSGVSDIEESVAYQLTQLVQVLNLMGIASHISGIRPEVARKAMSFGLEFHRIPKIRSIQEVIQNETD